MLSFLIMHNFRKFRTFLIDYSEVQKGHLEYDLQIRPVRKL